MSQTILPTDLYVAGNLSGKTFTPPAGSIGDAAVAGAAGVQASKLQHQYEPVYAQGSTSAAAAAQQALHVVKGATATVVDFSAAAVTPAIGADTCSVDLWKNGASILTAAISLTNSEAARALIVGTLASTGLVAGDVLEVKVTPNHSSGTLPSGVFARLTLREDAQ